jgi:hypothetical protein
MYVTGLAGGRWPLDDNGLTGKLLKNGFFET